MSQLLFPLSCPCFEEGDTETQPVPVQIRPTPLNEFKNKSDFIKEHLFPTLNFVPRGVSNLWTFRLLAEMKKLVPLR